LKEILVFENRGKFVKLVIESFFAYIFQYFIQFRTI
jgi:hypothetical protein